VRTLTQTTHKRHHIRIQNHHSLQGSQYFILNIYSIESTIFIITNLIIYFYLHIYNYIVRTLTQTTHKRHHIRIQNHHSLQGSQYFILNIYSIESTIFIITNLIIYFYLHIYNYIVRTFTQTTHKRHHIRIQNHHSLQGSQYFILNIYSIESTIFIITTSLSISIYTFIII